MKRFIIIIAIIVLLDQITKFLAKILIGEKTIVLVKNILHLNLTKNTGAAFSLLQGNNFILTLLGLVILCVLVYYLFHSGRDEAIALSMIIGGAIGNLIDRVLHEGVIDFIQISIWPIFNLADVAISVGAILLIYSLVKKEND